MRRIALVTAIVFIFCSFVIAAAWAAGGAGRGSAKRVPVLLYHEIVPGQARVPLEVGANDLDLQMHYLKIRGYHFTTTEEVASFVEGKAVLPRRSVLVTFDDGYENNYTLAFPIMKRYGVKATIFVITSKVGTPGYLTPAEITEMHASGLVEFQLHTDSLHYKTDAGQSAVLAAPPETLTADLETARAKLVSWTGQEPSTFAYPFGSYNGEVAAPLKAARVAAAFTVEPGYVRPGDNVYQLHRIPVFVMLHRRYFLHYIAVVEGWRA